MAKKPYESAQKRKAVIDIQIGHRLAENIIVDTALEYMTSVMDDKKKKKEMIEEDDCRMGTNYEISIIVCVMINFPVVMNPLKYSTAYKMNEYNPQEVEIPNKKHPFIDSELLADAWLGLARLVQSQTLLQQNFGNLKWRQDKHESIISTFTCVTEMKRHDVVFRAHPNYKSNGPWFDWVIIRYEEKPPDGEHLDGCHVNYGDHPNLRGRFRYAPAQIYAFLRHPDGLLALVKSCGYDHKKHSVFSTIWKSEFEDNGHGELVQRYDLIPTSSIVRHALLLPRNEEETEFEEIWTRERWANEFFEI